MKKPAGRNMGVPDATEIILESISDGVFTVDGEWRVTSFNRAAEEITGIPRDEAVGRRCCEVFRASMCETDCALRRTMDSGRPIVNKSAFIVDANGRRIPISVSTALLRDAAGKIVGGVETFRDLSLVEELRREIEQRYEMGDMVSRSASMRKLFDILPQVAASDATVVIEGETGTGKELLARALHNLGPRASRPFVAINCGALPDTLLESELFGYKAGAFTGAEKDKPGRFALAGGGTLFLDEIGDVSPALQARLLRVLQEKCYEPLGSSQSVATDVRVVTATNKNLAELVKAKAFRQDLYYRINVVRLELPPLRKRKEDIPLLVERFVRRFNQTQGRNVSGVSPETLALLMAHDYPGNIRELENIIEHAFVLCPDAVIGPGCLPETLAAKHAAKASFPSPVAMPPLKAAEARAIMEAVEQSRGNRIEAARLLGMHKSTFFRKVRALGLSLPLQDGRGSLSGQ
ncbi:MAG: sigma 54-interacting transcriptional regulator [Candidatus Hydrogenedentes bacterium]|nr:sigma 54-interacting transcriptional regulator [Candidatus Hydrogenedentota bacterium]